MNCRNWLQKIAIELYLNEHEVIINSLYLPTVGVFLLMSVSASLPNKGQNQASVSSSLNVSSKSHWSKLPVIVDIISCFQSVQLAVVVLSLLAIATLIGVITPQEGTIEPAQIEQQFGVQYGFFKTLGFFNVFSSFWYITLQILFFFNLLIGSFKWLKRATLAAVQRQYLTDAVIGQKPLAYSLPKQYDLSIEAVLAQLTPILKGKRYQLHHKVSEDTGEHLIYAHKGSLTRFGPHIAHIGILLCLIACLIGVFTGFKAQKIAIPGAPAFGLREVDAFMPNMANEAYWLGKVPDWKVKVNKFWIEYYPPTPETAGAPPTPKQYYSDIELLDAKGKLIKQQVISVNHPIEHDFVTIYQASFTPSGMFNVKINGKPFHVGINDDFNGRPVSLIKLENGQTLIMLPFFAKQDPGVDNDFAAFVLKPSGETKEMPPNTRLGVGQKAELAGNTIEYIGPEYATGLQIKRAPEYYLMYLSYIIITIGAILSFFSQRQLWFSVKPIENGKSTVSVCPKTNKAWFSFRQEVAIMTRILGQRLSSTNQSVKEPSV